MFATVKPMEEECCQVCRINRYDDNTFQRIRCKSCNKVVHKYCYSPDIKENKPMFKCDQCKKSEPGVCSICYLANGILKEVKDGIWVHVMCGLFSEHVRVKSFRNLTFRPTGATPKENNKLICEICNKSKGQIFECLAEDCNNRAHVGCILGYNFLPDMEYKLTYNYLDRQHQCLWTHLQENVTDFECSRYLKPGKQKIFTCNDHNDEPHFVHCPCGISKLKKKQTLSQEMDLEQQSSSPEEPVNQVNCDMCGRWYHKQCTDFQKNQKNQEQFICAGCKQNDMFKKAVQFPELIEKLMHIEMQGKLEHKSIKFLDSVVFNISRDIIKVCKKDNQIVDKYYLRKTLERFTKKCKKMKNGEEKIMEIIYILSKKNYKPFIDMSIYDYQIIQKQFQDKKGFGISQSAFIRGRSIIENKINNSQQQVVSSGMPKSDSSSIKMKRPRNHSRIIADSPPHLPVQQSIIAIPSVSHSEEDKLQVKINEQKQQQILAEQQAIPAVTTSEMIENNLMVAEKRQSLLKDQTSEMKADKIDIVITMKSFIQNVSVSVILTQKQLAKITRKFMKTFEKDEFACTWIHQARSQNTPNFIEIFFQSELRTHDLITLFNRFRSALSENSMTDKLPWNETGFEKLSILKRTQIQTILSNELENKAIKSEAQVSEAIIQKVLKRIIVSTLPSRHRLVKDHIIDQILFLSAVDEATYSQYVDLYCSNKYMAQGQPVPDLLDINRAIELLREGLMSRINLLEDDEYVEFMGYINRSKFYISLVTFYYRENKQNRMEVVNPYQFETFGGYPQLLNYVQKAINNWHQSQESTEFLFRLYVLNPLSKMNLSKKEKKILSEFASKYLTKILRSFENYAGRMNSILLRQVCDFVRDIGKDKQFAQLLRYQEEYNSWKDKLNEIINIQELLETIEDSKHVYSTVDNALNRVKYFQLDMTCEIRKLKTMKCWAIISIKVLEFKTYKNIGLTFEHVNNIITYMKGCRYPKNTVSDEIQALFEECQQVYPQIQRLVKPRKFKNEELYEELIFIHSKPDITEGQQLVKLLEGSKVNWMKEIDDIERCILQGQSVVKQFKQQTEEQPVSISTLDKMRTTMVESPFNLDKDLIFNELYTKIYHTKAKIEKIQYNRADYNRMLTYAGKDLLKFCQRTTSVRHVYQAIQTAKEEARKEQPKPQLLLNSRDGAELKKKLQGDKQTINEIDQLTRKSNQLSNQLYKLQCKNAFWEEFDQLIKQIRRHPVSLPVTLGDIINHKTILNQLLQRIRGILADPNEYLDNQGWQSIINRYTENKMRHKQMEEFIQIYKTAKTVTALSRDHSLRNYQEFLSKCEQFEVISKNEKILKIRAAYLKTIFNNLKSKKQPTDKDKERMLKEASFLCYQLDQTHPNYLDMINVLAVMSNSVVGQIQLPAKPRQASRSREVAPRPPSNMVVEEKVRITKKVIKKRMVPSDNNEEDRQQYQNVTRKTKKERRGSESSGSGY